MPGAIGIPEDMLREAAKMAVCKLTLIPICVWQMTGTIRKYFNEHPEHFDPRQYLILHVLRLKKWLHIKLKMYWAVTVRRNKY